MMKNFKEYLAESKKTYDFRVKIAGTFEGEQDLKSLLGRFSVAGFKKLAETPIQELPLDFPQVKNCQVHIYEVSLDYPTTQQELTEYLSAGLSVNPSMIAVRRPGEPSEEYQAETEPRKGALLDDPTYKEAGDPRFEDYYGDKYNTGFVKELNDVLKLQRRERGEEIPNPGAAKYNTDSPADARSPLEQAPDPRKK